MGQTLRKDKTLAVCKGTSFLGIYMWGCDNNCLLATGSWQRNFFKILYILLFLDLQYFNHKNVFLKWTVHFLPFLQRMHQRSTLSPRLLRAKCSCEPTRLWLWPSEPGLFSLSFPPHWTWSGNSQCTTSCFVCGSDSTPISSLAFFSCVLGWYI